MTRRLSSNAREPDRALCATVLSSRRRFCATLFVVGAALVTGCGPGASAPSSGDQAGSAAASALQAGQTELDHIYTTITGTATQRGAGERVAYGLEQDPFTECMRANGVAYDPIAFVDAWSGWPAASSGAFSTKWLASLTDEDHLVEVVQAEGVAQNKVAADQAASDKAYAALSDSDKAAWDKSINTRDEGKDFAEAWHPPGYYPLLAKYRTMVDSVDNSLDDAFSAAYQQCMRPSGYDVANHMDLVDGLRAGAPPPQDIPPPGTGGDSVWVDWVETVHAASRADGACRAAAYDAGWKTLGPEVAAFEQDNAQALAEEEAGWEQLVAQA